MAFLRDEAGVLTILSLLFFVMLMAAGGLSIDLGRLYGERGQMQAFVDSAALSAASQLDRSHDAMDRAVCAVMGTSDSNCTASQLISGSETFSTTPGDFAATKVTFLQSLDPDWQPTDATPAPNDAVLCTYTYDTSAGSGSWSASSCDTVAGNNAEAQYVEVVTAPRTVSYLLLPITDIIGKLFGASSMISGQSISLRATAGFKQVICDNVPLMVCNPDEATDGAGADFDLNGQDDGKQLFAYGQSNGGTIGPGMFGLLNTYGSGGNALRNAFAQANPNTTCTEETVPPKTGVTTGPDSQGVNVRFDIFNGGGLSRSDSTVNETAPVVVKGEITTVPKGNSSSCQYKQSSQTIPYPRDNCFMATAGTGGTGCSVPDSNGVYRMGDGNWDRQAYWLTNHGTNWPPSDWDEAKYGPSATAGRYNVYEYEIDHTAGDTLDEKRAPTCSTGNKSADRRIFTIAVVNCKSEDITKTAVPIKAYARVFLTEPVGNTDWSGQSRGGLTWPTIQNSDTYVEIIGVVKPGDDTGELHQFPVLYR